MTVQDKIVNSLMGSNIKTIRVTAMQLAELIYNCFVNEEKSVLHINRVGGNFSFEKFPTSHTTVRTVRYTAVQST